MGAIPCGCSFTSTVKKKTCLSCTVVESLGTMGDWRNFGTNSRRIKCIFQHMILFNTLYLRQIWWLFYYIHLESLNPANKTRYFVHNSHSNLCWQVENSKWILCSRRKGCLNVQFFMHKKNSNLFNIFNNCN